MTQLSPAARAVMDDAFSVYDCEALYSLTEGQHASMIAAAAIRAAADQAAPELPHSELDDPEILKGIWGERRACRAELLAIATELATPPPKPPEPPLKAPSDQEIEEWADAATDVPLEEMDPNVHGWRRCFTKEEFCASIRAALERWGAK